MKIIKSITALTLCLMLLLSMSTDVIGQSRKKHRKSTKTTSSQIKKITPRVEAGLNGEFTVKQPVTAPGYTEGKEGVPGIVNDRVDNYNKKNADLKQKEKSNKQELVKQEQQTANYQTHKHVKTCLKCTKEPLNGNRVSATFKNICKANKPISFKLLSSSDVTVTLYPNQIWISKEHNITFPIGNISIKMID